MGLRAKYLIAALLLGITAIFVAAVFVVAESHRGQEIELNKRLAAQQLGILQARLEGQLNANLIILRALRAEITLNPNIDQRRFDRIAEELLNDELQVRHLAIAPDLIIRSIYPLAGNENAIGFDYRDNPAQLTTVEQAIESRQMVLAGPLELVQGGEALVARMPLFIGENERFWGVLALVIDTEALFAAAGFTTSNGEFRFALRGANGTGETGPTIAGDPDLWQADVLTTPIAVPQGEWALATFPVADTWHVDKSGYVARWAVGLAITLVMILGLLLILMTQLKLRSALTTISHQARFDPLTELPNRHYFVQQLEALIQSALRHNTNFAVLFIDLDHFKEVNDSLGHESGDQLLQQIASRIRASIRPEDLVARLGGDEFVVVLRNLADSDQAEQRARLIVQDIQPTMLLKQSEVSVSASIGIAMFPVDGMRASELLKHADLAMYAAKAAGRQTIHLFNQTLRYAAEQHVSLHQDILTGLERGDFQVHYQPVLDIETNRIQKCEALLRWHHPQIGTIPPVEFIPVAEKTGAIRALGEFVLQQVCRDWHRLQEQGITMMMSMNRSAREFNDVGIATEWLELLQTQQMPAKFLMIEITESMLMLSKERQLNNLRLLKEGGVRIAIDDFGTGYSSINYLRRYPVDYIKIDRSFLFDVPENDRQKSLLNTLIQIARNLEMQVIVEGVETDAQMTFLRELNCRYLQGFLISRPLPFEQLQSYLRDISETH